MHKLIDITKQDAISKFGHHFVVSRSHDVDNKYGFVVKECIGNGNDGWYSTDEFYTSIGDAFSAMRKEIKSKYEAIVKDFEKMESMYSNKWLLFRHGMGWLNKSRSNVINSQLKEFEDAKSILASIDSADLSTYVKILPKNMKFEDLNIDKNGKYYYFIDSNTIQHEYKIQVLSVSEYSPRFDYDTSTIKIDVHFVSNNGDRIGDSLTSRNFKNFNGDYLTLGYTNCYFFFDKEKCTSFITDKINKQIIDLQKLLIDFENS